MKSKKTLLAGGLLLVAAVASLYCFLNRAPVAHVKNATSSAITVRLETDVGESYSVGTIAAGSSARIGITGRDKLLWAVVQFPDGRVKQSQKTYTTTQGTVSVLVTSDAVELNYAL